MYSSKLSEWVGHFCAWLVIAMVLLISYDVAMRDLFQSGSVALQELEWHLFSVIFLLGASYTLKHDEHVRVDLFYRHRGVSERQRRWINILGSLFFLLPFCLLTIINSWPFVHNSYVFNEGSPDPGGLPYRWILKAMIPIGFSLLFLQGISEILINLKKLQDPQEHTYGKQDT